MLSMKMVLSATFLLVLMGAGQVMAKDSYESSGAPATYSLGTTERVHVLERVFLTSQPAPGDWILAKQAGIKTVINLRRPEELTRIDERGLVVAQGMIYVNIPFEGPEELTDSVFSAVRSELKSAARPVLLHCSSANRVGAVWLAYRVLDEGLAVELALAEAHGVGLTKPALEKKAVDYIERELKLSAKRNPVNTRATGHR